MLPLLPVLYTAAFFCCAENTVMVQNVCSAVYLPVEIFTFSPDFCFICVHAGGQHGSTGTCDRAGSV
jgi:hypothetical protein